MFQMKSVMKLALAAVTLWSTVGVTQAATVQCPPLPLPAGLTRYIEVTNALAGGECYYQLGNFNGDEFPQLTGETLIAKNGSNVDGSTTNTNNPSGATSGDWEITGANPWATYEDVFLAFHFGNGSGDPDSFIVELDPGFFDGTWALLPEGLANG